MGNQAICCASSGVEYEHFEAIHANNRRHKNGPSILDLDRSGGGISSNNTG